MLVGKYVQLHKQLKIHNSTYDKKWSLLKLYSRKHLKMRVFMYLNLRICFKCFPEFGPMFLMLPPVETRCHEKQIRLHVSDFWFLHVALLVKCFSLIYNQIAAQFIFLKIMDKEN